MLVERVLDLRGTDVLAPGDDHVLLPVDDMDRPRFVPDGQVAGMEIAVVDGRIGGLGLLVVAVEDHVGAHADFAHAGVVHGNRLAFLVEHASSTPIPGIPARERRAKSLSRV